MNRERKLICFVTGTRADFGKLKALIRSAAEVYDVHIFVTGMHMLAKYGSTYKEVERSFDLPMYKYINQRAGDSLDEVLAKTISGFSDYLRETKPDLVIVHGDRIEALACSMAACFASVLVGHVEGGEVSGTVDEMIRHAVTKVSHAHFVSNTEAAARLRQLGEAPESIYVTGSPDLDVMSGPDLPSLDEVRSHYGIPFGDYGICMFHPVVTEQEKIPGQAASLVEAMLRSGKNYVVVSPNNDPGHEFILNAYHKLEGQPRFVHRPSMRFEYFLVLLKNAQMMIGNSSAGVRETSFYGIGSLDLGTRQNGRAKAKSIQHVLEFDVDDLLRRITEIWGKRFPHEQEFGDGRSVEHFMAALASGVWSLSHQKRFVDLTT